MFNLIFVMGIFNLILVMGNGETKLVAPTLLGKILGIKEAGTYATLYLLYPLICRIRVLTMHSNIICN